MLLIYLNIQQRRNAGILWFPAMKMMNILHLSDFHVNKENHNEISELCNNIADSITKLGEGSYPDMVLVTGDLTEQGNSDEYKWFEEEFEKMLELSPFKKVKYTMFVPGNHDFSWQIEDTRTQSFENLCEKLEKGLSRLDSNKQEKLDKNLVKHVLIVGEEKDLLVIGMNSMKIDSKDKPGLGFFSKEQLRLVGEIVQKYKQNRRKKLQIMVAFHHHILPVAAVERETYERKEKYSMTLDARRAINTFLDNEVEFAVHGHQHQPSMVTWKDDERKDNNILHVISAGCLAGRMYAGEGARNSFMLYTIKNNMVIVNKAESSENDADQYVWSSVTYEDNQEILSLESNKETKELVQNNMCENMSIIHREIGELKTINKKRILSLAEQDDQWINRADQMGALTIKGLVEKLVDSIADDGSVAYEVNINGRYRTSTLATVLECMNDIRLLPEEDLLIMQHKLFSLKELFVPLNEADDVIEKNEEDKPAWGIDEAPSVWTTSKALIALFMTKFKPNESEQQSIAESVVWLAEQAYNDAMSLR